jgi:hypothetical protein
MPSGTQVCTAYPGDVSPSAALAVGVLVENADLGVGVDLPVDVCQFPNR